MRAAYLIHGLKLRWIDDVDEFVRKHEDPGEPLGAELTGGPPGGGALELLYNLSALVQAHLREEARGLHFDSNDDVVFARTCACLTSDG